MAITPCGYHVLIKAEKLEDVDPQLKKVKSAIPGFTFADHEDRKREQASLDKGKVVAVGSSAYSEEIKEGRQPWCKEGDFVVFAKYAGKGVTDPETHEQFIVLADSDVICVIRSNHE